MSKSKTASARENKRAKFTQSKKERKLPLPMLVGAGIIAVVAAIILWPSSGDASGQQVQADPSQVLEITEGAANPETLPVQDGAVRFPLSSFDDGLANFYVYRADDTAIQFFVLKSSDGVVRAAFNACDVCFASQRGYRQEGDEMVCNNCGQRFPSVLVNEVRGGCNPSPLERTVEGDELVITIADILSGAGYFQ